MNFKYLKKTPLPYTAASLAAVSYGGFMFDFMMSSAIGSYIGFSSLGLFGATVIGGLTYLKMNEDKIETKLKEEEYNKLKEQINKDFGHLELNNIFEKVSTIKNLIKEDSSKSSIFYLRMLGLVNHSLELYLENLELISKYNKVMAIDNSSLYKEEIEKNKTQNEDIVNKIDYFIKEFLDNQNNDSKMGDILSEYERNMSIYDEIKNIRQNS